MIETTQEERRAESWKAEARRLKDRLAAIEERVLVREELEAQGYEVLKAAEGWAKDEGGTYWSAAGEERDAPDLCPDTAGPLWLPIITLGTNPAPADQD